MPLKRLPHWAQRCQVLLRRAARAAPGVFMPAILHGSATVSIPATLELLGDRRGVALEPLDRVEPLGRHLAGGPAECARGASPAATLLPHFQHGVLCAVADGTFHGG